MGIKSFEDIIIWKKSQELTVEIYKNFKHLKDYGFKDQITRSAISVSNNIAEGFERNSKAEFKRFINISLGSNGELRSMLHIAPKLNYLNKDLADNLISKSYEISKMLAALRKKL